MAASAAHCQGHLTFSPTAANFGVVNVGSSKTLQVTITNTGSTPAVLKKENLNGAMYSVSGIIPPISILPGRHVVMSITFEPTKSGSVSGSVVIGSGVGPLITAIANYSLSGTGAAAVTLQSNPGSVAFGNVPVGTTVSKSVQLKNPGTGSATVSSVSVNGTGFSTSGLTLPLTLAAGSTKSFALTFTPTALGAENGAISLKNQSGAKELTLNVSGTGLKDTRTISASSAGLTFGNTTVGSAEKLAVTLKNTGNSNVTISGVSLTGVGVSSGLSQTTIPPGQTATLQVTFAPKGAGLLSGSVKISSNATNSPTVVTLSGNGVSPTVPSGGTGHSVGTPHSVFLSWDPSTSSGVVGYNVYRETSPGPPFAKLVNSTISALNYTDDTVKSGKTYTYVVTTVNSAGEESVYSESVTAVIP